jgi:hypothetical protein
LLFSARPLTQPRPDLSRLAIPGPLFSLQIPRTIDVSQKQFLGRTIALRPENRPQALEMLLFESNSVENFVEFFRKDLKKKLL